MRYCLEKGIPHDDWLSWSPESRAKHLAAMLFESDMCQLCGTAQWEWEENRFAYEAEEQFCQGCYIKAVSSEDRNSLPGTTINLVATTEQQKAERLLAAQRRAEMDYSQGDDD